MNYNVELTADSVVKIGKEYRSANKITVSVRSTEDTKGLPIRVTVRVGCGSKESDLLASQNDWVKVTCRQANGEPDEMSPNPLTNEKEWDTGMFRISLPASICLEGFVSNTPPGAAEICITGRDAEGRQLFSEVRSVTKELEKRGEPSIVYCSVDPSYILHAGQTEVVLNFLATGFDTVVLSRNNEEIKVWRVKDDGIGGRITGTFQDKPSITSVYRLEGYHGKTVSQALDRTVQVMSSGWNQIALPQGSPVRLFVANDFSGGTKERLYGIFRVDKKHYELYSSATGADAWRLEPGSVPQHMATSPGVVYKNKLWLIGGSSVKPDKTGNEVWCYEKGLWKNKPDPYDNSASPWVFPEEMEPRMGHSCIVFPRKIDRRIEEEIWVFGGYNNGIELSDLWGGKEVDNMLVWEKLNAKCQWPGRLNHAAAMFRRKDSWEVWMYGGSQEPQTVKNLYDLWTTEDGITWKEKKMENMDSVIVPSPGRPLGSALAASPVRGETDRLFLIGSFREWAPGAAEKKVGNRISSFIFEWQRDTQVWEVRPVFEGWQQFQGDTFYMQALAFNRFLFVWSLPLQAEFDSTLKLNILV